MKRRLFLLAATFLLLLFTGAALRRTSSVDAVSGASKLKKLRDAVMTNAAFSGRETGLKGTELKIATPSFPPDLDPAHGNGMYTLACGVGETLFAFDGVSVQPWLAQSWENLDALTWKILLKDGVKFQNGKSMTAQSVGESLERAVSLNTAAAELLPLDSFRAEGLTLTLRTSEPCPNLVYMLANPAFVIVAAKSDQIKNFSYFPVCTGPFVPVSFVGQLEMILRRFDTYHGGMPKLEGADIRFVSGTDKIAQKLENRTVDAAVDIPREDSAVFAKSGARTETVHTNSVMFLMMNTENPFLSDAAVRRTVVQAVEQKQADGGRYTGKKLTFRLALPAGDAELLTCAETVRTQLKKAGIDVTIRIYSDVFFMSRARYGKFDLLLTSAETAAYGDAQDFFESYVSSGGKFNFGHYRNGQVDAELRELKQEFDFDRRILLTGRIRSQIAEDAAFVFLGRRQTDIVTSKNVSGLSDGSGGYRLTADTSK
ncbi:MAG TPA: hypothetical protein DCL73_11865 [Treponema sp.]|nr:hypothetical protein [Treponema sp.]